MSVSTIIARRALALLWLAILAGCGANQVTVKGDFPEPVLEKLPVTIGVYYNPEFRSHTFHEQNAERNESDWIVQTGASQIKMYDILLNGMFERVVMLNDIPRRNRVDAVSEERVDAVLVPNVDELQYTIPRHTKVNVFEVWMRYRYQLYDPEGELLADWTMNSYGKTPTAFLKTAQDAVNQAAVVALRDAGANFALNFSSVPEVKLWIDTLEKAPAEAEPAASGSLLQ